MKQQKYKGKRQDTRAGTKDVPMALVAAWMSEKLSSMKLMATLNSRGRTQIRTAVLSVQ